MKAINDVRYPIYFKEFENDEASTALANTLVNITDIWQNSPR